MLKRPYRQKPKPSTAEIVENQTAATAKAVKLGLDEAFLRFLLDRIEDETTPGRHRPPSIGGMMACLEELKQADKHLRQAQTALGTPRADLNLWRVDLARLIRKVDGQIGWYDAVRRARAGRVGPPRREGVTWLLAVVSEYVRETTGKRHWPLVMDLVRPYVATPEYDALRVRLKPWRSEAPALLRGLEADFRAYSSPDDDSGQ